MTLFTTTTTSTTQFGATVAALATITFCEHLRDLYLSPSHPVHPVTRLARVRVGLLLLSYAVVQWALAQGYTRTAAVGYCVGVCRAMYCLLVYHHYSCPKRGVCLCYAVAMATVTVCVAFAHDSSMFTLLHNAQATAAADGAGTVSVLQRVLWCLMSSVSARFVLLRVQHPGLVCDGGYLDKLEHYAASNSVSSSKVPAK